MPTTYTEIQQSFVDAATNIGVVPEASVQTAESFIFGLVAYLAWPNGKVVYQELTAGTHIPIDGIGAMTLAHPESSTLFYSIGGGLCAASIQLYVEVDVARVSPLFLKFIFDITNTAVEVEFRMSNLAEKNVFYERYGVEDGLTDWTAPSREVVYEKLASWLNRKAKEVLVRNWWKSTLVDHQAAQTALYNLGLQS